MSIEKLNLLTKLNIEMDLLLTLNSDGLAEKNIRISSIIL